eukprot:2029478-Amphidinium_carterae.2
MVVRSLARAASDSRQQSSFALTMQQRSEGQPCPVCSCATLSYCPSGSRQLRTVVTDCFREVKATVAAPGDRQTEAATVKPTIINNHRMAVTSPTHEL